MYLGFKVSVRYSFGTVREQSAKHKFACCLLVIFQNQIYTFWSNVTELPL